MDNTNISVVESSKPRSQFFFGGGGFFFFFIFFIFIFCCCDFGCFCGRGR